MKIEIPVYSIESALKALDGGADRIEVCADAGEGGTTPSQGTVEVIRQNVSIDVYAMLRPRGGDFLYTSYEFHAMKRDLSQFMRLSVDGIVFGILNRDGTIDKKRCAEILQRARPLKATFHRAFDVTSDPFQALEDCIELGFDRILTSGQRKTALEGAPLISELRSRANGRIQIMAGAGITESTVEEVVRITQVDEIHFSASTYASSLMEHTNEAVVMGANGRSGNDFRSVDMECIRRIRAKAEAVKGNIPF
jgi:copper homeostasis protein